MRDKQVQQRRWRADGAIRSFVDRRPMGEDPALATSSVFAATRRTATRFRPQGTRRYFVDSAQRRSLAGFARRVPLASTCWRRLRDWEEQGVWLKIWRAFL